MPHGQVRARSRRLATRRTLSVLLTGSLSPENSMVNTIRLLASAMASLYMISASPALAQLDCRSGQETSIDTLYEKKIENTEWIAACDRSSFIKLCILQTLPLSIGENIEGNLIFQLIFSDQDNMPTRIVFRLHDQGNFSGNKFLFETLNLSTNEIHATIQWNETIPNHKEILLANHNRSAAEVPPSGFDKTINPHSNNALTGTDYWLQKLMESDTLITTFDIIHDEESVHTTGYFKLTGFSKALGVCYNFFSGLTSN